MRYATSHSRDRAKGASCAMFPARNRSWAHRLGGDRCLEGQAYRQRVASGFGGLAADSADERACSERAGLGLSGGWLSRRPGGVGLLSRWFSLLVSGCGCCRRFSRGFQKLRGGRLLSRCLVRPLCLCVAFRNCAADFYRVGSFSLSVSGCGCCRRFSRGF